MSFESLLGGKKMNRRAIGNSAFASHSGDFHDGVGL